MITQKSKPTKYIRNERTGHTTEISQDAVVPRGWYELTERKNTAINRAILTSSNGKEGRK